MEELEWVKCPYCHKEILGKSERASHINAFHPEHSLEGMAVVEMQYPSHWFRDGKPRKVRTRVLGRPDCGDGQNPQLPEACRELQATNNSDRGGER